MPEPHLAPGFEWVPAPAGRSFQCEPLARVAEHLFTTRERRLPSDGAADQDGWHVLARDMGVAPAQLVRLRQVHGRRVVSVPAEASRPRADGTWADADGAVTSTADVALVVKVADCVPLLIADRRTGAVAAVHAGWRGLAGGVVAAAVRALAACHGALPADLVAAIGPSIGPCCYQVGTEIADAFLDQGASARDAAEWFSRAPRPPQQDGLGLGARARAAGLAEVRGRLWFDAWRAAADQLAATGVPRAGIHVAGACTACFPELLHSYRVDGAHAGRMAGVIRARASR